MGQALLTLLGAAAERTGLESQTEGQHREEANALALPTRQLLVRRDSRHARRVASRVDQRLCRYPSRTCGFTHRFWLNLRGCLRRKGSSTVASPLSRLLSVPLNEHRIHGADERRAEKDVVLVSANSCSTSGCLSGEHDTHAAPRMPPTLELAARPISRSRTPPLRRKVGGRKRAVLCARRRESVATPTNGNRLASIETLGAAPNKAHLRRVRWSRAGVRGLFSRGGGPMKVGARDDSQRTARSLALRQFREMAGDRCGRSGTSSSAPAAS